MKIKEKESYTFKFSYEAEKFISDSDNESDDINGSVQIDYLGGLN